MQVDGFKDRGNRDSQWYEISIKTHSLCGIHLYNQYCAYGYGVCIIDELSDDIIVPDGVKKIEILSSALSDGNTIVLPVSIDYILISYSNMLYNYLKSNRRILATIVMSNSIKTETLVEMVRHILKDISSSKLGDINDRDSAINFIRKTICKLEFY